MPMRGNPRAHFLAHFCQLDFGPHLQIMNLTAFEINCPKGTLGGVESRTQRHPYGCCSTLLNIAFTLQGGTLGSFQ